MRRTSVMARASSMASGSANDVVLGVIERRIATQVDWARYTDVGVPGLDEIALKKAIGIS